MTLMVYIDGINDEKFEFTLIYAIYGSEEIVH